MTWLWMALAFALGVVMGVLIRLIGEALCDVLEMDTPGEWWL